VPAAKMLPGFPACGWRVNGRAIRQRPQLSGLAIPFATASRHVKAVTREGQLVAIGEAVLPNLYHPVWCCDALAACLR